MRDRNYFPFYYSWANLINKYVDSGDVKTAKALALTIIRYAAHHEITDPNDRRLLQIFETIQQERGYINDSNSVKN